MSDIDFLANQKGDDQKPKNQDDKEDKIVWSKPDEDKPFIKEAPFFALPFFGKKKEASAPAAEPKPAVDRNKIKESRREILQLIKRDKKSGLAEKQKQRQRRSLWAGLIEKLKKQPSHKEVLIDYQRVFNQEKIKRSKLDEKPDIKPVAISQEPVKVFKAGWFSEFFKSLKRLFSALNAPKVKSAKLIAKPVVPPPAAVAPKPEIIKPVKRIRSGFSSGFFKMIKDKIAALKRPKAKPFKTNSAEISKEIKPKIIQPPPAAIVAKPEIKIKENVLSKAEPVLAREEQPEVLETNLIKGEIITFFDWQRKIVILINAIFIPVFIIAVIYLGLMYYQNQNQAKVQERIKRSDELAAEIRQAEIGLAEVTGFQARLKTVSQVFAKHIYWTNLFKFLEDNTIKDIYYTGFSGDTSGAYSLDAIGAKFSDISKQIGVLSNNEKIIDILTTGGEAVSGGASNQGEVKFNLKFSILKSIFTE